MTRLLAHRVVAGAAIGCQALALGACSLVPGVVVSRDHAIAVALDHAKLANEVLVSADEGSWPLGREPRRAWIITIRGNYLDCVGPARRGSDSERCEMVDGQAVISVDGATGEFLGGNLGGPIEETGP
jgi:hypothetical protein